MEYYLAIKDVEDKDLLTQKQVENIVVPRYLQGIGSRTHLGFQNVWMLKSLI